MIGIICLALYVLLVLKHYFEGKSNFLVTALYITMAPLIKIKSLCIDPTYFVLIIYIIGLLKNKKIYVSKDKAFLFIGFFSLVLYTISTMFHSSIEFSTIQKILGSIKIPLIIILFNNYYYNKNLEKEFDKYITLTLIFNLIASISQILLKDKILAFYQNLYSDGIDYYTTVSGKYCYARTFGLFSTPMIYGIVCLFIFTYVIFKYKKTGTLNYFHLILCLILGVLSSSKSFIIGVPIIIFISLISKIFSRKKIRKNTVLLFMVLLICSPFLIYIFNQFVEFLTSKGMFIKYYLNFLSNPISALSSRYSSNDDILLKKTYEVIKQYPVFGVGYNSVNGEFTGDSTYVLALHNGGIISLISIVLFFIHEFKNSFHSWKFLFVITWVLTGFAYPTLFGVSNIIPFIYIFYHNFEEKTEVTG